SRTCLQRAVPRAARRARAGAGNVASRADSHARVPRLRRLLPAPARRRRARARGAASAPQGIRDGAERSRPAGSRAPARQHLPTRVAMSRADRGSLAPPASLSYPPFRVDVADERLWRDGRVVTLRPKTFAVLRYLAEHPGVLATKDELLDAVWGRIAV